MILYNGDVNHICVCCFPCYSGSNHPFRGYHVSFIYELLKRCRLYLKSLFYFLFFSKILNFDFWKSSIFNFNFKSSIFNFNFKSSIFNFIFKSSILFSKTHFGFFSHIALGTKDWIMSLKKLAFVDVNLWIYFRQFVLRLICDFGLSFW